MSAEMQTRRYVDHITRCAVDNVRPLTYPQFLRISRLAGGDRQNLLSYPGGIDPDYGLEPLSRLDVWASVPRRRG